MEFLHPYSRRIKLNNLLGLVAFFILPFLSTKLSGQETAAFSNGPQVVNASELLSALPESKVVLANTAATATAPSSATFLSPRAARLADLKATLADAAAMLEEDDLPDPEAAGKRLAAALVATESHIQIGTQNGDNWAKFMKLDAIREQLKTEKPNLALIAELEKNLQQNFPGLAQPVVIELRSAVNMFRRAKRYGANPQGTITGLTRQIGQLAASLEQSPSDTELAQNVGRLVNLLYQCDQSPELVNALRTPFAASNLQISVNEFFLNRVLSRSIARPAPVDECILGTRVLGQACLQGSVSANIHSCSHAVSIEVKMDGVMSTLNRGYNRGVVLGTSSSSPVHLSKHIVASMQSVSAEPARVTTNLATQINSISHKLKLVRKIARKKAAQQKPLADAISEGRLQRRLRSEYDTEVDTQVAQANAQLADANSPSPSNPVLKRLNIPRPAVALHSTEDQILGNVVQAAAYQLAASEACPIDKPAQSDAIIELHQSIVMNALQSFLGERTIRDSDLRSLAKQFLGKVPEDMEKPDEAFTIAMVGYNPVIVEFDKGLAKLTLRFSRLDGADREIRNAIVKVAYRPGLEEGKLVLRREGDLEVELPTVRSATTRTSLRSAARSKMRPIFKEEIVLEKLNLKQFMPQAPEVELNHLQIQDGWLQLGVH